MKVYEYSWWWRRNPARRSPVILDVHQTRRKSERNDLLVPSLLAPLLGGFHHGTTIRNTEEQFLSGSSFWAQKRRPPHDMFCSSRHQMTSGEELVVKSRKAVGVAVAMQIWVEVLAAIAWKHILRGTQIDMKKGPKTRPCCHPWACLDVYICLFLWWHLETMQLKHGLFLWTSKVARAK